MNLFMYSIKGLIIHWCFQLMPNVWIKTIAFYPNLIKKLFPKIKFILGNKKWSQEAQRRTILGKI